MLFRSVKKRLNGEARDGLSFTEFTYQLLQGYDFLHLYETKGCNNIRAFGNGTDFFALFNAFYKLRKLVKIRRPKDQINVREAFLEFFFVLLRNAAAKTDFQVFVSFFFPFSP